MITKKDSLENTILNALWNLEENCHEMTDVSDIQNRINAGSKKWAYTTVKTVLDRLVEKKLITRNKQGKKYYYNSRISRVSSGEQAIQKLARQYYNNDIIALARAVERVKSELTALV